MLSEPSRREEQRLAQQLADDIREQLAIPVDEVPATRSTRQLYWVMGIIAALVVAGIEVGILEHEDAAGTPAAPPQVVAVYQANPCAQRMRAITDAIAKYAQLKGTPPADLSILQQRGYLSVPPVDPISGQPYRYERMGNGVSVSCPNPDRHPAR